MTQIHEEHEEVNVLCFSAFYANHVSRFPPKNAAETNVTEKIKNKMLKKKKIKDISEPSTAKPRLNLMELE